MNLTKEDAIHCAKVFENYFSSFSRIDEYMRDQKLASLAEMPSNPLFSPEDDLFSDFSMCPNAVSYTHLTLPTNREV